MKNFLIAFVFLVVLGGCLYGALVYFVPKVPVSATFDPRNATYTVENDQVTLVNGKAGSVEIFGGTTAGDVNDDGVSDAVFFLTQTSEGSGTFFYVVAALNTADGTLGTNAVLLGDRIAPQNITIDAGTIVVAYEDRAEGEPMTTPPSVNKSLSLTVRNNILQEATAGYAFTYLTSSAETTAYCDGSTMDSAGYRASLTVQNTGTIPNSTPTTEEIIRATVDAATTGMCHTVMSQTTITEKDGVVTIAPIDGWAGVSITMCSCRPQVEVNILQIPGMKKVIWSDGGSVDAHTNIIILESPVPNATVTSPLQIAGEARGSWFFEGSFPVKLLDSQGNVVGQGIAQAQGDWMTTDFVPFKATVTYIAKTQVIGSAGTLRLEKDNPSGLPANDDALTIPVVIGK